MILDALWITSPLTVGGIVFVFVFGGAMLGVLLRAYLPEHHLSAESKDVVRLGIGLLATMSALVLGLLIASAKTSYEAQRTDIAQMASKSARRRGARASRTLERAYDLRGTAEPRP